MKAVSDRPSLLVLLIGLSLSGHVLATNPLIMDQFTADPTARVFEGKIYVYPSHDIPASPGRGRTNWFVMEDYHVLSSKNLTDWTDHGVILNQTNVPWLDRQSFDMWAPDCVFKDGKYYFYFPTGGTIGVAIADKPYGPFKPEPKPIEGVRGIDPCVLIDKDGSAYIYYSRGKIYVAKLKDNLLELGSEPEIIGNLPSKGLLEGPFVFERKGVYYLTYPHVETAIERLEYSIADHPMGPFKPAGVILDESQSGCWTVHHSIVEYEGQWYLFYHDRELSPDFDKNRSIRADYLHFNEDGTIRKVVPTLRGVGLVDATNRIQVDRYSALGSEGASISFLNPTNTFAGWKTSLSGTNAWVQFDRVDFGKHEYRSAIARAASPAGGAVEIHLDKADGPLLARVEIAAGSNWEQFKSQLATVPTGIHNLVVIQKGSAPLELDWISFE